MAFGLTGGASGQFPRSTLGAEQQAREVPVFGAPLNFRKMLWIRLLLWRSALMVAALAGTF